MISTPFLKFIEKKYFGSLKRTPKEVNDLRQEFFTLEVQIIELFKLLNRSHEKSTSFVEQQCSDILRTYSLVLQKLTKLDS